MGTCHEQYPWKCVLYVNPIGKGASYGDSGDPLVVNGILLGLLSAGCSFGYPDIYTNLYKSQDRIQIEMHGTMR